MTQNKGSGCRKICILCQQTSPKRWFGNMEMTSNRDVTTSAHQIQMTTLWPSTKTPPMKIWVRHCILCLIFYQKACTVGFQHFAIFLNNQFQFCKHKCSILLDASKVFDRVLHMKLFEKLIQRKVPMCFVRLLKHWYKEQTLQIKWGKHLSEPFHVSNGVRQGGAVAYAKNFHGGVSFSGIWWSFVCGVRSLWRHNLTSYSCFQTNVLAKFVDIICMFF